MAAIGSDIPPGGIYKIVAQSRKLRPARVREGVNRFQSQPTIDHGQVASISFLSCPLSFKFQHDSNQTSKT